jgi:hypothetical protein
MRTQTLTAGLMALLASSVCAGQSVMVGVGTSLHLVNDDLAMLEAQIERKDLDCEVKESDPTLGFDLRFHTGYDVSIPLKELIGEENLLTTIFRVTPEADPDKRVYFTQATRVPKIEEDARGNAALSGIFDLGEGKYHVDWLMRDRQNHVCAHFWDTTAKLGASERDIQLDIAANVAQATSTEHFLEDAPVRRDNAAPLNVKLMVNFAPQNQNSAALRPIDSLALVTMMRRITREPQIGKFSLVAFNIQEQRVIFRQSSADRIDFPALGQAVAEVEPGLVDLKLLANKRGEVDFLTDLIRDEISATERPDAVIFAGPKYMVTEGDPQDELRAVEADYPIFYLNYNLNPQNVPWRDSIGRAIRVFGGREFAVNRPRDLFFAVNEIVNLILASKHLSPTKIVESKQEAIPGSR